MLILAVDATGGAASCALAQEDVLLAESYLNIGYTHSETLLPLIEGMLHTARRTMEQVDRLAVTVGPGSFTGIRIGLATVKGLAFARGIPCVPVSALEAMAVLCPPVEGVLCPAMDARRSQVYNALFAWQEGALRRLTPDRAQMCIRDRWQSESLSPTAWRRPRRWGARLQRSCARATWWRCAERWGRERPVSYTHLRLTMLFSKSSRACAPSKA